MTTEMFIPLHILDKITDGFSVNSIIGTGGYGNVYKGVHDGREIAVKLLHVDTVHGLDDQQFKNEVGNLWRVQHQNIVQLVGYCYETRKIYVEHNSANNLSERIYRVICFEYLQGGSLDKRLFDQSFAPNWSTRYNIIKGISEGLKFLHGREPPILHLDLKPANILLDSSMEPKLADFGLSRLFTQAHTHSTQRIIGTQKYMPPECIDDHKISPKNDVFSLGVVMIDIMTGPAGYSSSYDMGDLAQLMQQVLAKWSTAIEATSKYPSDEKLQVQTCIKLAIRCVDPERDNRPYVADIVDTLNKTETNIPKIQLADELPCPTVGPSSTESDTLEMMIAELENISNKDKHYNSTPGTRDTTAYVEEEIIFGRTEEIHEILSTLSCSMTKETVILPIYGIGGIGKTTLAQLVFNNTQFQECSRVWVYVSEIFDLKKIGNSIISQLSKESSHIAETQIIHNRLGELFDDKSTLIVLDDLWEKDECKLDELKTMLRLGRGSKVIVVTTRDEAIAVEICDHAVPYKLETLSDDMCWKIIKQKSAFKRRVDKKQLKCIGREIATKCGGVALAAQSLGYMLRKMKHSNQWESVRDNCIWNLSTLKDPSSGLQKVLASLLLSYSHMPAWLKLCFTYCAVFPKGHHIAKYDLIHQWIALRFTEQSDMFDPIQLSEAYIEELLGMSFLQYSKTQPSNNGQLDKDVIFFTMHDLVYDLARAILAHQDNDYGNAGGDRCRYALLTYPLHLSVNFPRNLKALHFWGFGNLELRVDAFFLPTCLRVLDLRGGLIQKLPDSIGQLRHLRYLCAQRIKDWVIPNCITELAELTYLNLRGSHNILALPESIGDMKGLMHLDLSGCNGIEELPISFSELKQLVHLDLSDCNMCICNSESFDGFTQLQYLNLSDNYQNMRGLTKFISNLTKLRYLNLSSCFADQPGEIQSLVGSICTLSNLEHLDLSKNWVISSIPESISNLRKLHTLDLSGCRRLKKLPDSMVKMVSLKVLNVDRSVALDESMLSLLNIVSLPRFMVHASIHKCSSNIILLQPTNPVELMIDRLENVKSAEEARSIKLIEKQKIAQLTFQWTRSAQRTVDDKEVLEKLVPPINVKELSIYGYKSASFPDWLMGMRLYLPNLCHIELCYFANCNNLPSLGQLPYLQTLNVGYMDSLEEWNPAYSSGEEGANELLFPMLEELKIENCAKLRRWSVEHYSMFPKLRKLTMEYCAKLRIEPYLPGAKELRVKCCDYVLSSAGGASSSSPVTKLYVQESKVPLHEWRLLHHLPTLRTLIINDWSDLTISPEIIKKLSTLQSLSLEEQHEAELPRWLVSLTSLQTLTLRGWRSMTSLPHWLVELASLQELALDGCRSMTSLPQLTSLQSLSLRRCYSMTLLPQWLVELTSLQELNLVDCESMTSLPHCLGELASLKKLQIGLCQGIKSLPDSIQQLTKLEVLRILCCPTLKEWCESKENKMKLSHIRQKELRDRLWGAS